MQRAIAGYLSYCSIEYRDSKQEKNNRSQSSKFQLDISLPTNDLHGYGRGNDRNTIMHIVNGFSNRLQHR